MGDLGRGSRDLVRNIESMGSILSIKKKTDGRERSSSMLVDKDGDPRSMLVDKDGDPRPMLVDKDGEISLPWNGELFFAVEK